jgi:hypothetical protein
VNAPEGEKKCPSTLGWVTVFVRTECRWPACFAIQGEKNRSEIVRFCFLGGRSRCACGTSFAPGCLRVIRSPPPAARLRLDCSRRGAKERRLGEWGADCNSLRGAAQVKGGRCPTCELRLELALVDGRRDRFAAFRTAIRRRSVKVISALDAEPKLHVELATSKDTE